MPRILPLINYLIIMTKADFFSQLQTLSIEQLSIVHENVLKKIQRVRSEAKQQTLKLEQTDQEPEKTKEGTVKGQPKMPVGNLNIKTMADNLDLDLSSIMREIAKR